MEPVLLITDERMLEHDAGVGHPERPDRLRAILDRLAAEPVEGAERVDAEPAPDEAFERLHTPAYVASVLALEGQTARLDADTAVSPGSIDAARLSCGAAFQLVDALMQVDMPRRGFALGRPPGHHAESHRAMGFCLFGNIALAAERAISMHGLERVLILDWDVHHGNGTQELLEARGDIAVFNIHQGGIFPGTGLVTERGIGAGEGATVNVPLPGGSGDAAHLAAMLDVFVPFADRFKPQLLLVSAGFDAHEDDPLAGQRVSTEGFAAMCAIAREVAEHHCEGRLGLVLEGGYALDALADSVHACVRVLAGATVPIIESDAGRAMPAIVAARRAHKLASA